MVHIAIPEPTSFDTVYNQRSLPQYLHSLYSAGATPIPIPLHESPQRVAKILSTCRGVLLPGSPADIDPQTYGESPIPQCEKPDPARASVDELLIQDAFNLHKPILAICQGAQALNVWCGGTLIQDVPSQVGDKVNHSPGRSVHEAHLIEITPGTRLAALAGNGHVGNGHSGGIEEHVNSSHHQAIRAAGDNLVVSGRCREDDVIEAVELSASDHFAVAVQWHPERTYDVSAFSRNIFAAFVHAAEAWTPRRIEESVLHA
jgi:putative glutamine amidotransferase